MAKGSRRTPKKPPTEIRAEQEEARYVEGESIPVDEPESHVQRHRPDGPQKRTIGEPRSVISSTSGRLDRIADETSDIYHAASEAPIAGQKADYMVAAGFDAKDDEGKVWQADAGTHHRTGKDINHVALIVAGKDGRSR